MFCFGVFFLDFLFFFLGLDVFLVGLGCFF